MDELDWSNVFVASYYNKVRIFCYMKIIQVQTFPSEMSKKFKLIAKS